MEHRQPARAPLEKQPISSSNLVGLGIRIRHLDNFDITGAPGNVPSENTLGSTTYQNCWNLLDQNNITSAPGDVSDVD